MMVCCFGQMWAMSSKFFVDVPYNLLLSCIEHPLLTVDRLINYFLKGQGLSTNWFVVSLLQLTTWQLIRSSTCII